MTKGIKIDQEIKIHYDNLRLKLEELSSRAYKLSSELHSQENAFWEDYADKASELSFLYCEIVAAVEDLNKKEWVKGDEEKLPKSAKPKMKSIKMQRDVLGQVLAEDAFK